MDEIIDDIVGRIESYQDDHPGTIITDNMIKGVVESKMDKIVEEIKSLINTGEGEYYSLDEIFEEDLKNLNELTIRGE